MENAIFLKRFSLQGQQKQQLGIFQPSCLFGTTLLSGRCIIARHCLVKMLIIYYTNVCFFKIPFQLFIAERVHLRIRSGIIVNRRHFAVKDHEQRVDALTHSAWPRPHYIQTPPSLRIHSVLIICKSRPLM